jgi:diguanylate cyclase (GGDEF)-like protein
VNALRKARQLLAAVTGRRPRPALVDRTELLAALADNIGGTTPCAVVLLSLDAFTTVNEWYGRQAGDAVLAQVAAKLAELAGEYDGAVAARLRGDEFALVAPSPLPEVTHAWGYEALCALASIAVGDVAVRASTVRASIGVVHGRPGDEPARLLHAADTALFEAKVSGGDAVVLYDPDAQLPTVDSQPPVRLRELAAIERAVARGVGSA